MVCLILTKIGVWFLRYNVRVEVVNTTKCPKFKTYIPIRMCEVCEHHIMRDLILGYVNCNYENWKVYYMITEITIEGIVTYNEEFDSWRVDYDSIENIISDFDNRKVVVTITEI